MFVGPIEKMVGALLHICLKSTKFGKHGRYSISGMNKASHHAVKEARYDVRLGLWRTSEEVDIAILVMS